MTSRPSLASLLIDHPSPADAPLLHGPNATLTAGEARAAARAVATRLADAGVEPGQAVAVQMRDGPQLITTMFGVWLAGAVFVPVNPRVPAPEVEKVLASTAVAVLVTGNGTEVVTAVDGPCRTYEPDAAFVMWTSGTTGEPKPILHQHAAYFELLDRVLGPLPREAARRVAPGVAQPDRRLHLAERRHLQRPVRVAGRCSDRRDGRVRARRVRGAGTPVRDPLDGAAAGGDDDARR